MIETPAKSTTASVRAAGWRRWSEPWYLAYGLQGAALAGVVPILVPLVVSQSGPAGARPGGGAVSVGLVMASLSLGGLTAPIWGWLADRLRVHRWLLVMGLLAAAVSLAVTAVAATPGAWVALALVVGVASATVANLFIVELHAKEEWDERIGWLQTFYAGGQVAGLLLASVLSAALPRLGLFIAAALVGFAVVPAWFKTVRPPASPAPKPVLLHPAWHGEGAIGSPMRLFHHLDRQALGVLAQHVRTPFGVFIALWLLSFGGSAAVFALYPVLMQQAFGVTPGLSSVVFAVAATLGFLLYSAAGRWSQGFGALAVLRGGLVVRLIAFAAMLFLALTRPGSATWLVPFCFGLVVLAWSVLSVTGTALAAELAPTAQGEAIGIFNAATAVAGVVGALIGGWAAGRLGYAAAPALATAGVGLGLLLAFGVPAGQRGEPAPFMARLRTCW